MFKDSFIDRIILEDITNDKNIRIVTRFPPEPNGRLHIGHAKSILLNYFLAKRYKGDFVLRYDDTNPYTIDPECYAGILEDCLWLGVHPSRVSYASDYFNQMITYAYELILSELAYVCPIPNEIFQKQYKGNRYRPGKNSLGRQHSKQKNLELFGQMLLGKPAVSEYALRAKIDMSSGNMSMRDPVLFSLRDTPHPRQGSCFVYPSYTYAQPIADYLDKVTHSICTLEFAEQNEFYSWVLSNIATGHHIPKQIEFARLELSNIFTSKRKINQIIESGQVSGFDDPRLHSISGLRNRGYPALTVKNFCFSTGISRSNSKIDSLLLKKQLRKDLETTADRYLLVLEPVAARIKNYDAKTLQLPRRSDSVRCGGKLWLEAQDILSEKERLIAVGKCINLIGIGKLFCSEIIFNSNKKPREVILEVADDDLEAIGNFHWVDRDNSKRLLVTHYLDNMTKRFYEAVGEDVLHSLKTHERIQAYRIGYFIHKGDGMYQMIETIHNKQYE